MSDQPLCQRNSLVVSPTLLMELKELAEKATPGPWSAERWRHKNDWRVNSENLQSLAELRGADTSANTRTGADAAFIAAANPATVLALIAEVERLTKLAAHLDAACVQQIRAGEILAGRERTYQDEAEYYLGKLNELWNLAMPSRKGHYARDLGTKVLNLAADACAYQQRQSIAVLATATKVVTQEGGSDA